MPSKIFFILTISITLFIPVLGSLYVSPLSTCYQNCEGSLNQPYNNLWAALQNNSGSNITIVLMGNKTTLHYLQSNVIVPGIINITYPVSLQLNGSIIIKPFLCSDPIAVNWPGQCVLDGEKVTVRLKDETMQLKIASNLTLYSIKFDGLDNIAFINPTNTQNSLCLNYQTPCCLENANVSVIDSTILCQPQLQNIFVSGYSNNAFFTLDSTLSSPLLNISSCSFTNIYFLNTPIFIRLNQGSLIIENSDFQNIYFYAGLVSKTTNTPPQANLKVSNVTFDGINKYNIQDKSTIFRANLFDLFLTRLEFTDGKILNTALQKTALINLSKSQNSIVRNILLQNVSILAPTSFIGLFYLLDTQISISNIQSDQVRIILSSLIHLQTGSIGDLYNLTFVNSYLRCATLQAAFIFAAEGSQISLQKISFINNTLESTRTSSSMIHINTLTYKLITDITITQSRFAVNSFGIFFSNSKATSYSSAYNLSNFLVTSNRILRGNSAFLFAFIYTKLENISIVGNTLYSGFFMVLRSHKQSIMSDINFCDNLIYGTTDIEIDMILDQNSKLGIYDIQRMNVSNNLMQENAYVFDIRPLKIVNITTLTFNYNRVTSETSYSCFITAYQLTQLKIVNATFLSNYVQGIFLFYMALNSSTYFQNVLVEDNYFFSDGSLTGFIQLYDNYNNLSMIDCVIKKNQLEKYNLFFVYDWSDLGGHFFNFTNFIYEENQIIDSAMFFQAINSKIIINNFQLTSNYMLYLSNLKYALFTLLNCEMSINSINISNNTLYGSSKLFVCNTESKLTVKDAGISNNLLAEDANLEPYIFFYGALSYGSFSNIYITQNKIEAGAIIASFTANVLNLTDIIIIHNNFEAKKGYSQALLLSYTTHSFLNNITCESNVIQSQGGYSSLIEIDNDSPNTPFQINFTRNSIKNVLSYFIIFTNVQIELKDSSFTENSIINQASGLKIINSDLTFTRVQLTKNVLSSVDEPSSFCSFESGTLKIMESSIIFNLISDESYFITIINEDSKFYLRNTNLSNNELSSNAIFFKLKFDAQTFISDVNFYQNKLYDQSNFISMNIRPILYLSNVNIENNQLSSKTYFLTANYYSIINANDMNIVQNSLLLDSDLKTYFMFYFYASTFSLTNINLKSNYGLFSAFISSGSLNRLYASDVQAVQYKRQLMFLYESTLKIELMNLVSDAELYQTDQWISATGSDIVLRNLEIRDIRAQFGYFINLINSTLEFSKSSIINFYFESGVLLNNYDVSKMMLSQLLIKDSSTLINILSGSYLLMQNIRISFEKSNSYIISLKEVETVILKNLTVICTSNKFSTLTSGINLQDIKNSLLISNTIVQNLRTKYGSIYILVSNQRISANISNTVFIENTATDSFSGGLTIDQSGPSVYIFSGLIFDKNFALNQGGRGGAMYLGSNIDSDPPSYTIKNCKFSNNYADQNGGAIYVNGVPPRITDSYFENNLVKKRINNIASQTVKLEIIYPYYQNFSQNPSPKYDPVWEIMENFTITNIGSGINLPSSMIVSLKDLYGQIVYDDSTSILILQAENSEKVKISISSFKANDGIFAIDNINFIFSPGLSTIIRLKTEAISDFKGLQFPKDFDRSTIKINLSFRDCEYGEVLLENGACDPCKYGYATYDFSVNSKTACKKCDLVSSICLGKNLVGPNRGHWRANIASDNFLKCPIPKACLPYKENSIQPEEGKCSFPYKGNLCGNCVEGYVIYRNDCRSCSESFLQYIFLVLGLIFNLFLVKSSVNKVEAAGKKHLNEELDESGSILKSIINFLQLCSLIASIKINWPSIIFQSTKIGDELSISSTDIFTLRCFYPKHSLDYTYIDLIISNVTPFALFILASLILIIWYLLTNIQKFKKPEFKDSIIVIFIVLCFNFQSSVLIKNLELFDCENIYSTETPKQFLKKNYDIECWVGEHRKWLFYFATPMIILWGFIFPALLFWILWRNRNKLNTKNVAMCYSFIYKGYKPQKFYWEFMIMMRKYFLIIIGIFGAYQSVSFQICGAIYVITISFIMEIKNDPFLVKDLNKLQLSSLQSLSLLCLCALFYHFVLTIEALNIIVMILWIIPTLYYLRHWFFKFITGYLKPLIKNLMKKKKGEKQPTVIQNVLQPEEEIINEKQKDEESVIMINNPENNNNNNLSSRQDILFSFESSDDEKAREKSLIKLDSVLFDKSQDKIIASKKLKTSRGEVTPSSQKANFRLYTS